MRKLVHEISSSREESLAVDQVNTLFNALWPDLNGKLDEARQKVPPTDIVRRTTEEMLEEVVERVRQIERRSESTSTGRTLLASSAPRIYVGGLRLPDNVRDCVDEMIDVLGAERVAGWLYRDRELELQLTDEPLTDDEKQSLTTIAAGHNVRLTRIYTSFE
jgi:hypothetical protein